MDLLPEGGRWIVVAHAAFTKTGNTAQFVPGSQGSSLNVFNNSMVSVSRTEGKKVMGNGKEVEKLRRGEVEKGFTVKAQGRLFWKYIYCRTVHCSRSFANVYK
jgi:hypothetical protein